MRLYEKTLAEQSDGGTSSLFMTLTVMETALPEPPSPLAMSWYFSKLYTQINAHLFFIQMEGKQVVIRKWYGDKY